MIKLTRIDDRLVHGQVALVWTPALSADCLIVANDSIAKDEFQKMTLGFAKPPNARLLIKSLNETVNFLRDPQNDKLKILLIVNSVKDALALAVNITEINSINFGGLRGKEGSKFVSKAIAVTKADLEFSQMLLARGIELEVRQVPSDKKLMFMDLVEKVDFLN